MLFQRRIFEEARVRRDIEGGMVRQPKLISQVEEGKILQVRAGEETTTSKREVRDSLCRKSRDTEESAKCVLWRERPTWDGMMGRIVGLMDVGR